MSDDYPNADVFSDTILSDTTFSIQDNDECIVEDLPLDDDDDDVEQNAHDNDGDNVEQTVHDQLSSVEEVKSSQSYYNPTAQLLAKNNRRKLYLVISGGFVAVIATIVVIAVATTNKSSSATTSTINNPNNSRFEEIVNFLFVNQISSYPALVLRGSVEHYAALFLADGDAYQSEPTLMNERKFVERYVLSLLYYQTNGKGWRNHYKFLSGRDHCEWTETITNPAGTFIKGVECNDEGYVTGLDLANNNLVSRQHPRSIPAEIIHLKSLEKLHLHYNDLGGNIPNIQSMKNIKSIGLMNTGLKGSIPEWFGDMVQLTTLALSRNDFYSSIPDSFKNLVNLRILGLDGMGLKGSINILKGMNNLEALYLEDNHLTGELQGNVWPHMKELDVSSNMLDGTIPNNLLHSPSLKVLDLHRNLFYGDFLSDIVVNDSLEYIAVNQNSLNGQFSDRIGYLTNLKHFDIASNLLTGTLPDTIKQLTNLVLLSTSGNNFSKQRVHDYFSNMPNLKALSMKGNNFTGTLPAFFGDINSLQLLDLDGNYLSGSIPTWYGLMTNLHALMLNRNELTGTIPKSLTQLKQLKVLLLDSNNLHGNANHICLSPVRPRLEHFVADCYTGKNEEVLPEIECRCCTLCCDDEDFDCNNKSWMIDNNSKAMLGYIRADYDFGLDEAPEDWSKKAREEAMAGSK